MLVKEQSKIVTVPNVLSSIRLFLLMPAAAYYLWNGYNWAAALLSVAGGLMDLADGYIARHYNQKSELGKILDPLADKLFVAMLIIILFLQGRVPTWYIAIVVSRDLLILLAGIYASRRLNVVLPSNNLGRYTALSVSLGLVFAVINFYIAFQILMYASLILMAASLYSYSVILLKNLKQAKQ